MRTAAMKLVSASAPCDHEIRLGLRSGRRLSDLVTQTLIGAPDKPPHSALRYSICGTFAPPDLRKRRILCRGLLAALGFGALLAFHHHSVMYVVALIISICT